MKYLFALPLFTVLGLSSCSTVQSARDKLTQMPEADYRILATVVHEGGLIAGEKLAELIGDHPNVITDAKFTIHALGLAIENDQINAEDIVRYLVDRLANDIGLNESQKDIIRDAGRLIDTAVGQIKVDIFGKLSDREKELILSLLEGLQYGLSI